MRNIVVSLSPAAHLISPTHVPHVLSLLENVPVNDGENVLSFYSASYNILYRLTTLYSRLDHSTRARIIRVCSTFSSHSVTLMIKQFDMGNKQFVQDMLASPCLPSLELVEFLHRISANRYPHEDSDNDDMVALVGLIYDEIIKRDKKLLKNVRFHALAYTAEQVNMLVRFADKDIVATWFYHPDAEPGVVYERLRSLHRLEDFMVVAALGKLFHLRRSQRLKVISQLTRPHTSLMSIVCEWLSNTSSPDDFLKLLPHDFYHIFKPFTFTRFSSWLFALWDYYITHNALHTPPLLNVLRFASAEQLGVHAQPHRFEHAYRSFKKYSPPLSPPSPPGLAKFQEYWLSFDPLRLHTLTGNELASLDSTAYFDQPHIWDILLNATASDHEATGGHAAVEGDQVFREELMKSLVTASYSKFITTTNNYSEVDDCLRMRVIDTIMDTAPVPLLYDVDKHFPARSLMFLGVFYLKLLSNGFDEIKFISTQNWVNNWQGSFTQLYDLVIVHA